MPLLTLATRVGATKIDFIIDTGASISFLPCLAVVGILLESTPVHLSSAGGDHIRCYSQANLEIIPSLRRAYQWTFVISDVTNPLLGLDFLKQFQLVVDCKNKCISDSITERR